MKVHIATNMNWARVRLTGPLMVLRNGFEDVLVIAELAYQAKHWPTKSSVEWFMSTGGQTAC